MSILIFNITFNTNTAINTTTNTYTNTNTNTNTIKGAQADTVIKSIKTLRMTCPQMPVYKDLDYGDPLPPLVTPLIPPSLVKGNTNIHTYTNTNT